MRLFQNRSIQVLSVGYLQTDGYAVYEQHGKKKEITHLACWAHARREFERALDNDGAEQALLLIQQLVLIRKRIEGLHRPK